MGQFGKVSQVKIARSRKTAGSKRFAFIQFKELATRPGTAYRTAEIFAESMNNYLLFNCLIKCYVMKPDTDLEKLFKNKYKNYDEALTKIAQMNEKQRDKSGDRYFNRPAKNITRAGLRKQKSHEAVVEKLKGM